MVKKVIKVVMIGGMILLVAWSGVCIAGNIVMLKQASPQASSLPSVEKAPYKITLLSTGRVLYAASYERQGAFVTLHRYWERHGTKYVYRDADIRLSEETFSKITIDRR
jgi:hypothetical protein